jgi:sec-independent protein translocase protein TatA
MPFDLGWPEIILVLLIVIIIFGAGKLPQIGGALGKGIREFHKARTEDDDREKNIKDQAIVERKPGEKS